MDAKTRYALLAALYLAEQEANGRAVKVSQIAAQTGAPRRYLAHILLSLKRGAIVRSVRGAQGGYRLLRPATRIAVAEILTAIQSKRHSTLSPLQNPYEQAVWRLWQDAEVNLMQFLRSHTLADMLSRMPKLAAQ